ncbi:hypothetical protein ACIBKX_22460 [Streptomyces sp. NPDC050658]|uniref:hypothetical protein n=1 Tax=unclassified Streptomyces TaxID=2593676 RepID=UPI00341957D3
MLNIAMLLRKDRRRQCNAFVETSSEHRREPISLREDIENVERQLCWHHSRISGWEGDAPTEQNECVDQRHDMASL